nr:unnamed protein product [Haemonchus contortus]
MRANTIEKKDQADRILFTTRCSARGHPCESLVSSFNQFLITSNTEPKHELDSAFAQPIDLFKFNQLSEDFKKIADDLEKQSEKGEKH